MWAEALPLGTAKEEGFVALARGGGDLRENVGRLLEVGAEDLNLGGHLSYDRFRVLPCLPLSVGTRSPHITV